MRRHLTAILVSGGAAATAIMLSATAAVAATWSVSPAGTFAGTLNTGTTTLLKDTTTGITLTCTKSTSNGNVPKAGHGLAGKGIATITKTTWGTSTTPCSGPAGSTFTASSLNTPWKLNAVSFKAGVDGGQTVGTITAAGAGVGGKLTGNVLGAACSATIGGTTGSPAVAHGLYDNGSRVLAITSVTNLKVTASTCPGVSVGDGATFITSPASKAGAKVTHGYHVNKAIKITSP